MANDPKKPGFFSQQNIQDGIDRMQYAARQQSNALGGFGGRGGGLIAQLMGFEGRPYWSRDAANNGVDYGMVFPWGMGGFGGHGGRGGSNPPPPNTGGPGPVPDPNGNGNGNGNNGQPDWTALQLLFPPKYNPAWRNTMKYGA